MSIQKDPFKDRDLEKPLIFSQWTKNSDSLETCTSTKNKKGYAKFQQQDQLSSEFT